MVIHGKITPNFKQFSVVCSRIDMTNILDNNINAVFYKLNRLLKRKRQFVSNSSGRPIVVRHDWCRVEKFLNTSLRNLVWRNIDHTVKLLLKKILINNNVKTTLDLPLLVTYILVAIISKTAVKQLRTKDRLCHL